MSGIVGIVNRKSVPVDRALLERMTAQLAFRGPDSRGVWIDRRVGFGHALLQTTDDGPFDRQPLSLDGQVWITADARIDDRYRLVHELNLGSAGFDPFPTDAELILRAYLTWGDKCLDHLLGDFSFAIWDGRTDRLWCARDHFGVKPFFYAALSSGLVFGNTLVSLRQHPGVSDTLDDQAVGDFLLFGYNAEPDSTTFADIRRLPAAHSLEWTAGHLQIRRYWTMPVREPVRYSDPGEYVERFGRLLRSAVGDRLRTRRLAVSMSGGLDSCSVAATAHELLSKSGPFDLRAWTVVCDTLIQDEERHYAGLVADELRIPISFQDAASCKYFERRDHRSFQSPEPRSLGGAASQVDKFQQVARHSRVMLTGQGGDVILRPSPSYFLQTLRRFELGQFAGDAWRHFRSSGRFPRFGVRARVHRWLGKAHRSDGQFPAWIDPAFAARLNLRDRWSQVYRFRLDHVDHHRPEAYQILIAPHWPRLFERFDAGQTGFPLEYRHPLFDLRLADFVLTVPSMPWCIEKALTRAAMRGKLPEAVRLRRKTALISSPLETLLKDPGADWMSEVPESPVLRRYVRPNVLSGLRGAQGTASTVALNFRPLYLNCWLQTLESTRQRPGEPQQECDDAVTGR